MTQGKLFNNGKEISSKRKRVSVISKGRIRTKRRCGRSEYSGEKGTHYTTVPDEILLMIMERVPIGSRFNAALVCRRWSDVCWRIRNIYQSNKFIAHAFHGEDKSLWEEVVDKETGKLTIPDHMMTEEIFTHAAMFVEDPDIFSQFMEHPLLHSTLEKAEETLLKSAIFNDNIVAFATMMNRPYFAKHFTMETLGLVYQTLGNFHWKTKCLSYLLESGIADEFMNDIRLARFLTINKWDNSIKKLSKRPAFYADRECVITYANYALNSRWEDLLLKIMKKCFGMEGLFVTLLLTRACKRGWSRTVNLAIKGGIDPSSSGQKALEIACENGFINVMEELIVDKRVRFWEGMDGMVRKCLVIKKDSAAAFLMKHCSVDVTNVTSKQTSLLWLACEYKCPKSLKLLLCKKGIDPNVFGHSPIRVAIKKKFYEGIRMIVAHKDTKLNFEEVNSIASIAKIYADNALKDTVLKSSQFSEAYQIYSNPIEFSPPPSSEEEKM